MGSTLNTQRSLRKSASGGEPVLERELGDGGVAAVVFDPDEESVGIVAAVAGVGGDAGGECEGAPFRGGKGRRRGDAASGSATKEGDSSRSVAVNQVGGRACVPVFAERAALCRRKPVRFTGQTEPRRFRERAFEPGRRGGDSAGGGGEIRAERFLSEWRRERKPALSQSGAPIARRERRSRF